MPAPFLLGPGIKPPFYSSTVFKKVLESGRGKLKCNCTGVGAEKKNASLDFLLRVLQSFWRVSISILSFWIAGITISWPGNYLGYSVTTQPNSSLSSTGLTNFAMLSVDGLIG